MKSLIVTFLVLGSFTAQAKGKDCANYDQYKDVSMTEMQQIVSEKKVAIIDVNTKEMYEKGKIPGAVHYASNEANFAETLPKDKNAPIVAYCGGKMCTAWQKAAKAACELGYKNIRHFSEGITGWNKNTKAAKSTKG